MVTAIGLVLLLGVPDVTSLKTSDVACETAVMISSVSHPTEKKMPGATKVALNAH